MPVRTPAFQIKTMDKLTIRLLENSIDADACASFMAGSEPWITLGRGIVECRSLLMDADRERYIADVDGDVAGVIVISMRGAFVGYIQTLCVAPGFRGRGIGASLVRFAEERIFSRSPNVFICVSSFNKRARRLYERLGYEEIGELRDYIVSGKSEVLLRKTIGPIDSFKPGMQPDAGIAPSIALLQTSPSS